ncbi:MAG: hypothetical protein KF809_12990 [Chloroflexi bacterium]|nr:hypothetical protein [Chloroflexota bacterium]
MALCMAMAATPMPIVAATPSIADLQVHIGGYEPSWRMFGDDVDADTGEGGSGIAEPGSWTAEPTRQGDRLRLRVTITPPPVNPVLGPGPASLVTGVGVEYGRRSGGDVGYGQRLGFTWTPMEDCAGDPCSYTADVTVRLRPARRLIASIRDIESPVVVIGFTLVRTFGEGEWLQVSTTQDLEDGLRSQPVSRLTAAEGWIPQAAVVPTGEAHITGLRDGPNLGIDELTRLLDPAGPGSAPVPTVTVRLDVQATGCRAHQAVQLVDAWGTLPLAGSIATVGPAGILAAVPDRTSWSVAVGGTVVGTVDVQGEDRILAATVACRTAADGDETADGTLTVASVSEPLPAPPDPLAWLVAVESFRRDRPVTPSLPAAIRTGFIVIERTYERGWSVARSRDGLRWRDATDARLPAPLRRDAVRGPRIATAGGRVVLAGIVTDGLGGDRFTAWRSSDARRWATATVTAASGRPPATSLVLRSLVAADDRWFALADGDGTTGGFAWSSTDGRTWTGIVPRTPDGTSLVAVSAGASRLLGVARPDDPALPDLLVGSPDGRRWTTLAALPVGRAATMSIGETSTGRVVAAFGRSVIAPIEVWVSSDDGASWTRTLDGSVGLRLDGVTVRDETVVVAGSIRYGARGLEAAPWVASSRDGGASWRAEIPVNGYGDGRCATVVAIGPAAAILTVSGCSGNPIPRWRAGLSSDRPVPDDVSRTYIGQSIAAARSTLEMSRIALPSAGSKPSRPRMSHSTVR